MDLPIKYMTSAEAAEFLRVHPATMKNWRSKGGGPKYYRRDNGTIRYREDDLVRYVEGQADAKFS